MPNVFIEIVASKPVKVPRRAAPMAAGDVLCRVQFRDEADADFFTANLRWSSFAFRRVEDSAKPKPEHK